jgi:late competence protein required for DNA uptake (superfamily II DNA/RNA helicase)
MEGSGSFGNVHTDLLRASEKSFLDQLVLFGLKVEEAEDLVNIWLPRFSQLTEWEDIHKRLVLRYKDDFGNYWEPHFMTQKLSGGKFYEETVGYCHDYMQLTNLAGGKYSIHDAVFSHFAAGLYTNLELKPRLKQGSTKYCRNQLPHFSESLNENTICRMHIDLDGGEGTVLSDDDIKRISELFYEQYKSVYPATQGAVYYWIRNRTGGERKVHVYFPTLILEKKVLVYIGKEVKKFAFGLSHFIDCTYTGLRMPYSYKPDKVNSVYWPEYNTIEEFIVNMFKYRVTAFSWEWDKEVRPVMNQQYVKSFEYLQSAHFDCRAFTSTVQEKVAEFIAKHSLERDFEIISGSKGYQLKRKGPGYCMVCQREHDKSDSYIQWQGNTVIMNCWRNKNSSDSLVICMHGELTQEEKEEKKADRKRRLQSLSVVMYNHFVNIEIVHTPKLSSSNTIDPSNTIFKGDRLFQAVESPTDTAKTTILINFALNPKFKSILFLTSRRTLARDILKRMRQADIPVVSYLDTNDIGDEPFVIIQAESLHKIRRSYDLVIIDECTSFFTQMDSGLHEHLDMDRDMLQAVLAQAKNCIFLDADIDERTFVFLHELFPKETIYLTQNTWRPEGKKLIHYKSLEMQEMLKQDLREGEKIGIVVSSKKKGERIVEMVKQYTGKYKFFNSQACDPKDFEDINATLKDVQVVMFTSTIKEGVDIQIPFDRVYVFAGHTTCARDIKQMVGRFRHNRSNEVYYCNKSRREFYPLHFHGVKNAIEKEITMANEQGYKRLSDADRQLVNKNGKFLWKLRENIWTWMYIMGEVEKNRSYYDLDIMVDITMERAGYRVEYNTLEMDEEEVLSAKEEDSKCTEAAFNTQVQKYEEAVIPTYVEGEKTVINQIAVDELKQKIRDGKATEEIHTIVEKAEFVLMFKDESREEVTSEMIVHHEYLTPQLKHAHMELVSSTTELLQKELDKNRINGKLEVEMLERRKRFKFVELELVKKLCSVMISGEGVQCQSSVDRTWQCTTLDLEKMIPAIAELYPELKIQKDFKIQTKKPPDDVRQCIGLINTVFKNWSGSKLTVVKEHKDSSRRKIYTYQLEAPTDDFDHLLKNMRPPKPKKESLDLP